MRNLLLSLPFLLASGVALANDPEPLLDGTWGVTGSRDYGCANEDGMGWMIINGTSLKEYEAECRIRNLARAGGAWTMNVSCQFGPDDRWSYRARVTKSGNRLTMVTTANGETSTRNFVRCARQH